MEQKFIYFLVTIITLVKEIARE